MAQPTYAARCAGALALLAGLALAPGLDAQQALGAPNAVFPEDFGTIQTVRELPDGRLLVADPLGGELYVVDMDAGTRRVVGSRGQGPEEYMQPDATWALPGDSTLLVDLGNGRLTALGPDFRFGDTAPIGMGDPRAGRMILALPQGVDGSGHVYARAMGGFGQPGDSAAILRIHRGTRAIDTVATFKVPDVKRTESGSGNNQSVSISQVPLSAEDGWGVAPNGAVAIARSGDYHVEWHNPDGSVVRGPAMPFTAVRIGTAEKEEYVSEAGRSGGGVGVSVSVENGAVRTSFSRGGQGGGPREIDQYDWPDRKPAFYGGRLPIDMENRVWVRKHVDAGEPSTYDIFNSQGRHVRTVTLDPGKRVVGFGQSSVYVVSYDDFDLAYLERYDLPST